MKEVYKFKGRRVDVTNRPYYVWTYRDPMYSHYPTQLCIQFVEDFWRNSD